MKGYVLIVYVISVVELKLELKDETKGRFIVEKYGESKVELKQKGQVTTVIVLVQGGSLIVEVKINGQVFTVTELTRLDGIELTKGIMVEVIVELKFDVNEDIQ